MLESERPPLDLAISLPFTKTFVVSFHLHGILGKEGGRQRQEANGAGCSGCPGDRWSAGPWLLAPAGRRSRRAGKGLGSAGLRLVREKGQAQSARWEVRGSRASLRLLGPVQRFRSALGFS